MTWNYRVLRTDFDSGSYYGIHEVYDDKSYTLLPVKPQGDTAEELLDDLAKMMGAFEQPVLEIIDGELKEIER